MSSSQLRDDKELIYDANSLLSETRILSSHLALFHGLERVSNVVSYCLAELSRATHAQEGKQLTPDNSNLALSRTKIDILLDFRHAFTAILPSETRVSR